uniref:Uncharacterized protein n=1 Tax=Physcomitrium patens TaxID=3218 RepID=A0A2K1J2T5_PHYPA|nr:hypothetical protein PHYPA_021689 [Physcomitrium patens]
MNNLKREFSLVAVPPTNLTQKSSIVVELSNELTKLLSQEVDTNCAANRVTPPHCHENFIL